jgi:hypothetical protein
MDGTFLTPTYSLVSDLMGSIMVFLEALFSGAKTLGQYTQNNVSKMVLKILERLAFSKCKFSKMRFWKNGVE